MRYSSAATVPVNCTKFATKGFKLLEMIYYKTIISNRIIFGIILLLYKSLTNDCDIRPYSFSIAKHDTASSLSQHILELLIFLNYILKCCM